MKFLERITSGIFDLLFCVVLMPMLVLLGPARSWLLEWPVFFVLVCLMCYGYYFLLKRLNVPRLFISKNYGALLLAGVAFTCGVLLLSQYPLPKVDFYTPVLSEYQTRLRDYNVSVSLWMMFSIVVAFSLTVSFIKELYGQQLQREKLKHQKQSAELAALRAQISPHFLFNTLNSVYSLVLGTSEKAEDALIKFTSILEYTYMTVGNDMVAVRDEVDYISNYIDLQRLRLNECTRVDWRYEVDAPELLMPPLLLLTFVENAFKYGVSPSRESLICIRLCVKAGVMEFVAENSVVRKESALRGQGAVGIENCRARLENLCAGRHSLEIGESQGVFRVRLTLRLK